MISKLEKYPIIAICTLVFLMCLVSFSMLDVTIMEARNLITAREMVNDGNWLLTTLNGEPRYQKPPLPTWLTACTALIFGFKNILALRFPGILMIALTGIFSYLLSVRLVANKRQAFINALITISSFYVIGIVIEAPWDIFTHGFMLVAIYQLFQLFEKKEKYWKHTLMAGFFFGLSILSKGPISLYALLLPFIIAYGVVYQYKGFKQKAFSLFSFVLLALIVGGWWFLYVRLEDPQTFTEITSKETGNWGSYNVRPFYYYWSFFTQSGLWTIPALIALLYPYMKSRVSNLKAYRLSFWWTILSVVLLSVIPEKKSRYLMPVLIPLAINTGFYVHYLVTHFKNISNKKESIPVYFNFGLVGLIGVLFPISFFFIKDNLHGYLFWFVLASIGLFIIGTLLLNSLRKKNILNVLYASIGFLIIAMITLPPLAAAFQTRHDQTIDMLPNEIELYSFGYVAPEMIWQYGDKIPQIKPNDSTYNFPIAKQFGMLVQELKKDEQAHLETLYKVEYKETFDLNTKPIGEKGYRKRLASQFYLLTKK